MNEKNMALAEGLVSARYIKQVRVRTPPPRSARIFPPPTERSAYQNPKNSATRCRHAGALRLCAGNVFACASVRFYLEKYLCPLEQTGTSSNL